MANFSIPVEEINLAEESGEINLFDQSAGAVSWLWNFGDGSLSTEQNPLHTYADTGSFQVTLTVVGEDGCSSSAEGSIVVIEDAVLSDDEVSARADTRLFIYPNPAQEMLYLSFDLEQPGLAQYYLADLLGRPVRQGRRQVASRQTLELSLADLPAGAYLLVVDIDGDRLARRVVKSR